MSDDPSFERSPVAAAESGTSGCVDWDEIVARAEERYADGERRLPEEPDARQKQLVRMAMAAGAAGLAHLMQRRAEEARAWLVGSADRYRESFPAAPAGSWGRLIGAVKACVLADDWPRAADDARWALTQRPAEAASPIGRYAAALAHLVLGEDANALPLAQRLQAEGDDSFPRPVADALAAIARHDGDEYRTAIRAVLRSFEERESYLEDVPVADTVLMLDALAARRSFAANLRSPLLPP